jgi:bZIP factor
MHFRGDTFVILSRSRGWWIVQRDPNGSGVVDTDIVKQGWVPAGCLLETNVPVASAIAAAAAVKGTSGPSDVSKTPILPLSIISTSFPGIALMDYNKKGDEELELVEGDQLRVFKRYNHWSYVSETDSIVTQANLDHISGCKRARWRSRLGTSMFNDSFYS